MIAIVSEIPKHVVTKPKARRAFLHHARGTPIFAHSVVLDHWSAAAVTGRVSRPTLTRRITQHSRGKRPSRTRQESPNHSWSTVEQRHSKPPFFCTVSTGPSRVDAESLAQYPAGTQHRPLHKTVFPCNTTKRSWIPQSLQWSSSHQSCAPHNHFA